jgi:actin-related protein
LFLYTPAVFSYNEIRGGNIFLLIYYYTDFFLTDVFVIVFQANKEQLVQLMFETFNISGFYASEQAVLSLYAVGRISGCTVDIGHGKIGIYI